MKPILFLDIDGTLLKEPTFIEKSCNPFAAEFIRWAKKHFEVRWLTAWASDTPINEQDAIKLNKFHGLDLSVLEIASIPSQLWNEFKFDSVDEQELRDRNFVWLDDNPMFQDLSWLVIRKWGDRWINVNTTRIPGSLEAAKESLIKMFDIKEEK